MRLKRALSLVLILLMAASPLFAQTAEDSLFLRYQKIFVVVGVLVIIFLGIIGFLVFLERRVKRLEEDQKKL